MKRHKIFLLAEVLCFIIQPREWVANSRLYNSESFYRSSVTSAPALVCSSGASAAPVQWCVVFLICVPHCHVGKVRWSLSLGWNPLLLLQPLKPHPLSSRALMGRHLVLMGLGGAEQGCTVTACFQTLPLLFVWVPCLERKSLITFGSSLSRGSHQFTVASVGATLVCHWSLKNSTATFRP